MFTSVLIITKTIRGENDVWHPTQPLCHRTFGPADKETHGTDKIWAKINI